MPSVVTNTTCSPLRGVRQILFLLTTLIGLTFAVHAQDNVSGDEVSPLEHDESTLIYSLSVRGSRFGTDAGPIIGNGYLVFNYYTDEVTAIIKYSDGSSSVESWYENGLWYAVDVGPAIFWVVASLSDEVVPAFSYSQVLGRVHPSMVDIGGSQSYLAPTLSGDVRLGDATGNGAFGRATLTARILLANTRAVNNQGLQYVEVVESLKESLGISDPQISAAAGEIGASESTAIVLYHVRTNDLEVGAGWVDRYQGQGLLLIDYGTQELVYIDVWRSGNNRYYEIMTWTAGFPVWYTLTLGSNSYHVLGGTDIDEDYYDDVYGFGLGYGLNRMHPLGTGMMQSVPHALQGEYFEHWLGWYDNYYYKSDWTASIRPETVTLNQGEMNMDEAIDWVIDNMLSNYTNIDD